MDDTEKLIEEAIDEKESNVSNETYSDGDLQSVEDDVVVGITDVEGDVVAEDDPKEVWNQQVTANTDQVESETEYGSGSFRNARNAWANGWGA